MFFCKSSAIVLFVLFLSFCGSAFGLRDQDRKVSCRQPTPVDNAELEPEYEKKESFKNDDIVKYHCKHGYTIEGKSRERKCNNGEWSGIMFTCTYITCSYVHPPENGRRLDTNNGVGDYTEFDCDTGYTLKGYKKLLCRSNREWQPPDPPRCDPILCPELPGVRNGRVFQNDAEGIRNDYESVAEYTCNSGYYLNGQTKTRVYERKCQANGTWSGKQPICDVPRCENISPNFHNGTVRYFGDRKLWSHAFYKCDEMHSLYPTDREMSECTKAVRWEPEPPECKAMAEKVIPDHGYDSSRAKNLLHHLEYYTVRCFSDYELYSGRYLELDSLRITNIDGSLTPKVPECIEERCSIDVPDAYCLWEGDTDSCKRYDFKIPSQSIVNMKCKDGFKLFKSEYGSSIEVYGHASIFCRKGSYNKDYKCIPDNLIGTLQQYFSDLENTAYNLAETIERFKCRYLYHMSGTCKDPCLVPEIPYGFALNRYRNIAKEVRHGAIISVGCNKGYTVSERMSTTCRYGEWSRKDFPKCIPNPCSLEIPAGTLHWVNSRLLNVEIGETKTFKNGTELQLQCQDGYRMKDLNSKAWIQNTRKTQTCLLGTWTHQYACSPEPCIVPTISYAKLQSSSNVKTYEHGKTLTFECDTGYNFDWSEFRKKTRFEATCILGNWDKNIPKECKPDPCQLTLQVGASYFVDSNLLTEEDGEKQTFEIGTKLRTECNDGYRMKKTNSKKYLKHKRRQSTCLTGSWNRLYACYPEPCAVPRVSHATVSPKGTTQYDHEEKITISCDPGFHFNQNINLTVEKFETTCNFGKWKDDVPQECYPGCKLSDDQRFTYTDNEGVEQKPGSFIQNGSTLTVSCAEVDMYDYYTIYDYYASEVTQEHSITCIGDTLTQTELRCPEVTPYSCLKLQNGYVTKEYHYFIVSCKEGYSLNLTIPEYPVCTCKNGILRSKHGNQEPACMPDDCVVPYEFDERLSVIDKDGVSLLGGSVVKIKDVVTFNCSNAHKAVYEPSDRKFTCKNGQWVEAEIEENWSFSNNGRFPTCREAICNPSCENGGVCFKDDTCRCSEFTKGERCKEVYSYCNNGWVRNDDSCYLFVDLHRKVWQQAKADCEAQNSHLVVIESKTENDFLKNQLAKLHPGNEDQFWTNGNDLVTENTWVWGNTSDPFEVSFWYPGEPNQNGGEEDCLSFYTRYHFAWNDEHCNKPMPYICEIEDYVDSGSIIG